MRRSVWIRVGLCVGMLIVAWAGGVSLAADLAVDICETITNPQYGYIPMEIMLKEQSKQFFVFHQKPMADIKDVASLNIYYVSWTDRYGLIVSLSSGGAAKIRMAQQRKPDSLLGVVINGKLATVETAARIMNRERIKTEAFFTKNEAYNILKAYAALSQDVQNFRLVGSFILMVLGVLSTFGVVAIAVNFVRARVIRRRQKHLADLDETLRKDNLSSPWKSPF